jgi:hypothetical protein
MDKVHKTSDLRLGSFHNNKFTFSEILLGYLSKIPYILNEMFPISEIVIKIKIGNDCLNYSILIINNNNNSVALVRDRTIPTERPPLVGEVSANFCG